MDGLGSYLLKTYYLLYLRFQIVVKTLFTLFTLLNIGKLQPSQGKDLSFIEMRTSES